MRWRPCGNFSVYYKQELSVIRSKFQWALLASVIVLIAILPFISPLGLLDFFIRTFILLIIILGLEIVMGYCGQISLGHAAFACVGAFVGALLLKVGIPYLLALVVAGAAAGLTGLIFALPAVRVKGLYLAFSTVAAHFIIMFVIIHYAGGATGHEVKISRLLGFDFTSDIHVYFLVAVVLMILTYCTVNLLRSKAGNAFVAIRDHEIAADTLGVNIYGYKLLAFVIGCFYAGIGGFLWVTYFRWASVEYFTQWQAIWYVGIVVIGGMGSIEGVFFGTFFYQGINELCDVMAPKISDAFPAFEGTVIGALPVLAFSAALLVFLIFEPRGLAHRWRIILSSIRLYPFNY